MEATAVVAHVGDRLLPLESFLVVGQVEGTDDPVFGDGVDCRTSKIGTEDP